MVSSALFMSLDIIHSFVASVISGNASKVDQLWSIIPAVYTWHFYLHHSWVQGEKGADVAHDRLLLLCVLVSMWSVRLTYNFWLKNGCVDCPILFSCIE